MKEYTKPIARDVSGRIPYAEGVCVQGTVATGGGDPCIPGGTASGGTCGFGDTVSGCQNGLTVSNDCLTGGNV